MLNFNGIKNFNVIVIFNHIIFYKLFVIYTPLAWLGSILVIILSILTFVGLIFPSAVLLLVGALRHIIKNFNVIVIFNGIEFFKCIVIYKPIVIYTACSHLKIGSVKFEGERFGNPTTSHLVYRFQINITMVQCFPAFHPSCSST